MQPRVLLIPDRLLHTDRLYLFSPGSALTSARPDRDCALQFGASSDRGQRLQQMLYRTSLEPKPRLLFLFTPA